uniref:Uncharacterized protein n=1 Tax=Podoviridae sp. ctUm43 TaxID=2827738 RepID=A0A8S5SXA3_9CAUD|nr:MAG TPA: hypothetical protein [Podoviridae sp. ctUm43]
MGIRVGSAKLPIPHMQKTLSKRANRAAHITDVQNG